MNNYNYKSENGSGSKDNTSTKSVYLSHKNDEPYKRHFCINIMFIISTIVIIITIFSNNKSKTKY